MRQKKKSTSLLELEKLDRYRAAVRKKEQDDPVGFEAHKLIQFSVPRSLYLQLRTILVRRETTLQRAMAEYVCKIAMGDPKALSILAEVKEKVLRKKLADIQEQYGVEGGLNEHERDAIYSIIESAENEQEQDEEEDL